MRGVRLDSGDLPQLARDVRTILDREGCDDVSIFCSGSIDEYVLQRDFGADVPVDGFGIGTHLDVSADAPYLDCAYKLQEYAGVARRKRSAGKATWPGRKQVYRRYAESGALDLDTLALETEETAGVALLKPVMEGGRRLTAGPSLEKVRAHTAHNLASLPEALKQIPSAPSYRATISTGLGELARQVDGLCSQPDRCVV